MVPLLDFASSASKLFNVFVANVPMYCAIYNTPSPRIAYKYHGKFGPSLLRISFPADPKYTIPKEPGAKPKNVAEIKDLRK